MPERLVVLQRLLADAFVLDVAALKHPNIVAIELLAGRPPFPSGNMMMKAQKVFRPVSEMAPGPPQAADAVIARSFS
ncbi:MAG: hypothetical protein AAB262_06605 [Elusimicrobiota bacterium]